MDKTKASRMESRVFKEHTTIRVCGVWTQLASWDGSLSPGGEMAGLESSWFCILRDLDARAAAGV